MDNRRQLVTILVVSVLVAGGYFIYDVLGKSGPTDGGGDRQQQAQQTQPTKGGGPTKQPPGQRVDWDARREQQRLATIETDDFRATFTSLNGAMTRFELRGDRFKDREGLADQLVTTDKEPYLPLRIELRGVEIPEDATWEMQQLSPTALRFTWSGNGFRVERKVEAGSGPYQLWSTVSVTNASAGARPVRLITTVHHYVPREAEGGGFLGRPSAAVSHGVCQAGDETIRLDRETLEGYRHGYGGNVAFAGVENAYFATLVAADGVAAERCQLHAEPRGGTRDEPHGSLIETRLVYPRTEIAPGETTRLRTLAYVGPKLQAPLAAAGHRLPSVVDYGFFSFLARGLVTLLALIHGFVGNWGIAIILLTVLVKLVLYPLTEKSFRSMARMRVLKPEMDRINELYKDDREKKGAAVMELYRKHKINPLGGCLPSLLQLPVWFALYASLSTNVELYHAPFALWWDDLSAPDPFYVLPLVLGALMFLQQKITPTTMDPTQAKIMLYFMPIMITVFMLFLPAGLTLYMATNSALGIAQQQWIQHRLEKATAASAAASTPEKPAEATPSHDGSGDRVTQSTARAKPRPGSRTAQRRQRRGGRA